MILRAIFPTITNRIISRARARALVILQNDISSNGGNGCYLDLQVDDVVNCEVRENYIHANDDGIDLHLGRHTEPFRIENNVIMSNEYGLVLWSRHYLPIDICVGNNSITKNRLDGIWMRGEENAGIEVMFCVVSENRIGITFGDSTDNFAHFNDISENREKGVSVSSGAIVDAENNYWGSSSGPFHETINPTGQGNSVNGDGTDLDFIPFLTQRVDPIIPEFSSFLILPLFMASALIVVIIYRIVHFYYDDPKVKN